MYNAHTMLLHPQLKQDCYIVGKFPLCYLLLHKDANYPWFILVPDREDVTEIYQLPQDDQQQLMTESCELSVTLSRKFKADKLNVAAIGNIVPQLHIHHIVRYRRDVAWPSPIWGKHPPTNYTADNLKKRLQIIESSNMVNFDCYRP